jgi:GWxTD domain-containing protein
MIVVGSIFAVENQSQPNTRCNAISQPEFEKWVTEDVIDVLTDQEYESAQLVRATSDSERCAFITEFWARRDPYPDLDKNVAWSEHYRRKSYADHHFGTRTLAGSRTDRGRIFVLLGPPQCIRIGWPDVLQPFGSYPFEVWLYENIKVRDDRYDRLQLDFVDPGDESFRLATSLEKPLLRKPQPSQ